MAPVGCAGAIFDCDQAGDTVALCWPKWAHRNIDSAVSLQTLDARFLMWNIRRKINQLELPRSRSVIQFILKNAPQGTVNYWLVAKPGLDTDLCYTDPQFDVDLFITCGLRALTAAWMGHSAFKKEIDAGNIVLIGHEIIARNLTKWLVRSSYAIKASIEIGSGLADRAVSKTSEMVHKTERMGS